MQNLAQAGGVKENMRNNNDTIGHCEALAQVKRVFELVRVVEINKSRCNGASDEKITDSNN